MKKKNYYDQCASCIYCDLTMGYTEQGVLKFNCMRFWHLVEAEERKCERYKLKVERTNEMIELFISMCKE